MFSTNFYHKSLAQHDYTRVANTIDSQKSEDHDITDKLP
jgi:hypothetical protein